MSLCIIPFMVLLEYISTIKGIMKIKQRVQAILAARPVFLDAETTGLDHTAQIIDIAVIDHDGSVLLNTLIKPTIPIPQGATAIHGITDADVAYSPCFEVAIAMLSDILTPDRHLVIYNAAYDLRVLRQSAPIYMGGIFTVFEPAHPEIDTRIYMPIDHVHCAMLLYAEFWGDYNTYRHSYRWQSLSDAAKQQNITVPPGPHRALADAQLTRRLMLKMGAPEDKGDK